MNGLTGDDPETLSRGKTIASEETFSARGSMVGDFHAVSEYNLPSPVQNF
jgi:hypothetical protein